MRRRRIEAKRTRWRGGLCALLKREDTEKHAGAAENVATHVIIGLLVIDRNRILVLCGGASCF